MGFNDLGTVSPDIASQWHPTLNGELAPTQVTAQSHIVVWWRCAEGHEWKAKPNARVGGGTGCPVCSNRTIIRGQNDLETANALLAGEWHPTRNGAVLPGQVSPQSGVMAWWICSEGHEYKARVAERNATRGGTNCPYCSRRRLLTGFNDLATVAPEIARQWHPDKNNGTTPSDVPPASRKKVWWRCEIDPAHEWFQSPATRTRIGHKTGCAICSGKQVQVGVNDLETTSPNLVKEWHTSKNLPLKPSEVSRGSAVKIWWCCKQGHEWRQSPFNRQRLGCPYCSNKKVLAGYNDLATTRPDIAARWDKTNNIHQSPEEVTAGSTKRFWWTCPTDSAHRFKMSVVAVTNGRGCAVCSGQQVQVGVNDLSTIRPEIAAEWHSTRNDELKPTQVTISSHARIWWTCPKGHDYQSPIATRSSGSGCPVCDNKVVLVGFNDMATTNPTLAAEWHATRNGSLRPTDIVAGSLTAVWWQCAEGHEWKVKASQRHGEGTGCPTCAKYGFDPNKPGIVYFIEHAGLNARKIGITNQVTKGNRIQDFQFAGWVMVKQWKLTNGFNAQVMEKEMLHWIRKDLKLPPFLGVQEMKNTGGHSETFSAEGATDLEIIERADLVFSKFNEHPVGG